MDSASADLHLDTYDPTEEESDRTSDIPTQHPFFPGGTPLPDNDTRQSLRAWTATGIIFGLIGFVTVKGRR